MRNFWDDFPGDELSISQPSWDDGEPGYNSQVWDDSEPDYNSQVWDDGESEFDQSVWYNDENDYDESAWDDDDYNDNNCQFTQNGNTSCYNEPNLDDDFDIVRHIKMWY